MYEVAQYASDNEHEEPTQAFEEQEGGFLPENEPEFDDEFEFEESEYPFEEWTQPTPHQFTLAKVIQKLKKTLISTFLVIF